MRYGLESIGEEVGAFAYTRFKGNENLRATSGDAAGEVPRELREAAGEVVEIEAEPTMTVEQYVLPFAFAL